MVVITRSSHQWCFIKKAVLKNFAIFTGKHLCWSLFLIQLRVFRSVTLLKRNSQHRCFPVNIAKFLRTPFFRNIWEQLLLDDSANAVLKTVAFKNSLKYLFKLCFSYTYWNLVIKNSLVALTWLRQLDARVWQKMKNGIRLTKLWANF